MLFTLDIIVLLTFEIGLLKIHVFRNKLKEKGNDALSDGGVRYMHIFTEGDFSWRS